MAIITNSTTFTVSDASPVDTTTQDVVFASPNPSIILPGDPIGVSSGSLRRLTYPTTAFAPLIYSSNPDVYTNFNVSPLDVRPTVQTTGSLEDNLLVGWLGRSRDVSIEERWLGSTNKSRMKLDFFLELHNYYRNPPVNGQYIIWEPRDRTVKQYYIIIEALSLSLTGSAGQGAGDFEFDYLVTRHGYVAGSVTLRFKIISEV